MITQIYSNWNVWILKNFLNLLIFSIQLMQFSFLVWRRFLVCKKQFFYHDVIYFFNNFNYFWFNCIQKLFKCKWFQVNALFNQNILFHSPKIFISLSFEKFVHRSKINIPNYKIKTGSFASSIIERAHKMHYINSKKISKAKGSWTIDYYTLGEIETGPEHKDHS